MTPAGFELTIPASQRPTHALNRAATGIGISAVYMIRLGRRWHSWLRHCDSSRKVTGSIPEGVIDIILPAAMWSWG